METEISTDPSDYTDYSADNMQQETTQQLNTNHVKSSDSEDNCSPDPDPNPNPNPINFNKSIGTILSSSYCHSSELSYSSSSSYADDDCDDDDYCDDDYIPNNNNNYNKTKTKHYIECEICDKIFTSYELHRKHMNEIHKIWKPYICKICPKNDPKKYVKQISLKQHIERDHEGIKNFQCHLCSKEYYDKCSLKYHIKNHDNLTQPIPCTVCDDKFPSHPRFREHMNEIHKIDRPYICPKCPKNGNPPKRYASKGGLDGHIRRDHEMERRFKCKLCPKTFFDKGVLEKHQRVHDGLKPFECNRCNKRFSQKSTLRHHVMTIHLKQKNYKCSYCDKRFPSLSSMKSHVTAIHGDEKYARFECRTCCKRFYTKAAYYGHLDHQHKPKDPIKEKIKRGECIYPGCNKKYTSTKCAESVKYHLVHSHGDRHYAGYQCKKCDKLFYDRTSCRDHMTNKHNKNLSKSNVIKK